MLSFRLKTILGIACIEAVALVVLIVTSLNYLQTSNEDELRNRAYTTARVFASTTKDAVLSTDLSSLSSFTDGVLGNPGIVYSRIVGLNAVLAEGGDPAALKRPFREDRNVAEVDDGVFDAFAEINIDGTNYGRVELGISTENLMRLVTEARSNNILIALVEMFLVGLFSFGLGTYLTRGLASLQTGSQRIASGWLGYQIPVKGRDELAETAKAFNAMSKQLEISAQERVDAEHALQQLNEELEQRVSARTVELASANRELEHRAMHDGLTKLPNRVLFHDRLQQAILGARREQTRHGLIVIDLDRFKVANDSLGHHVGDLILQDVASKLLTCTRASDTVARLGGDEFAVLLPKITSRAEVAEVANRIRKAIESPVLLNQHRIDIGTSVGIALFPEDGDEVDSLMQHADFAMYEAKETRMGLVFYNPALGKKHMDQVVLQSELRQAIENDELVLYYQPKVSMSSGKIVGAEALVRWQHPTKGLLFPDSFIDLAEQSGLIKYLTLWVLKRAIRQCEEWLDSGYTISISVNISALNLQDPDFPGQVADIIDSARLPTTQLELELTETAVMQNPIRAIETIASLAGMGITFSIDDFGTGYSSMTYLKRLTLTTLKIDKSFVLDLAKDNNDAVIVRSTIDLGHNLGLKVVAEGVESDEVWRILAALGCDTAQGYYMSKPIPNEKFAEWLRSSQWGLGEPTSNPVQNFPLAKSNLS